MREKRLYKQILGVVIICIGSGVFWQFLTGKLVMVGISGIVLVSLGVYLALGDQLREQGHYHHPKA